MKRVPGFSLLEVLIAVVVLSVGLLALAALQGAMTRSSAEAKARGRVAAMLTARMDDLRTAGYGNIAVAAVPAVTVSREGVAGEDCGDGGNEWLDCPRVEAGLDRLQVSQDGKVWYGNASFAVSNAEQDSSIPQFKRVTLTATWSDAGGFAHAQSISTDVSSMALTNNMIVPPAPVATPTGGPIVRTVSPATDGVIPIAISLNDQFGGGGMHGYRALEGTFLGGCLFSGRTAGRAAAAAVR
jgi:prepilin-type N-terminal cleavage/methylation domain-containing protein